jgi:hypothetical protein
MAVVLQPAGVIINLYHYIHISLAEVYCTIPLSSFPLSISERIGGILGICGYRRPDAEKTGEHIPHLHGIFLDDNNIGVVWEFTCVTVVAAARGRAHAIVRE